MSTIELAKVAAFGLQVLALAIISHFALKLTRKVEKKGKLTAIVVKSLFVILAITPFIWIYFYGGQYIK